MTSKFVEILFWLKIVASPLILGVGVGFLCKIYFDNNLGSFLFGFFSFAGLLIGIRWANKATKKYGASNFYSKVNASTDIDEALTKKD